MDDFLFNPFSDDVSPILAPTDDTQGKTTTLTEDSLDTSEQKQAATPELSPIDIAHIKTSLLSLRAQIDSILDIVKGDKTIYRTLPPTNTALHRNEDPSSDQRMLEGIFDGEKMIGDDEGTYTIPPNYASKSKLVEGDRLKLTITHNGSFIYKQVKPIGRKRLVGELVLDPELNQWGVFSEGKLYKVLKASVTFYKGNIGEEAVVLVADDRPCVWGAIENIIHK